MFLRWAGPREAQGLRREAQLGGREGKARARGWLRDYERVGGGERSVRERIGIYLNAEELLLGGTLMEVWKTLLHCMVVSWIEGFFFFFFGRGVWRVGLVILGEGGFRYVTFV